MIYLILTKSKFRYLYEFNEKVTYILEPVAMLIIKNYLFDFEQNQVKLTNFYVKRWQIEKSKILC